ncbi:MAG: hypothetical protein KJ041_02885 [Gammaproteobacteria bacterium]|nr:hypothetical protein [Gammaproteobacteria bacterium]
MNCSHRDAGFCRRALGALLVLVTLGPLSGAAIADDRFVVGPIESPALPWTAPPLLRPPAPADGQEPPPLLRLDSAPDRLFAQEEPAPGLLFSIDPDEEEVFLGWRFQF